MMKGLIQGHSQQAAELGSNKPRLFMKSTLCTPMRERRAPARTAGGRGTAGAVIRQGQARRASPWGPAYPARVDQRSPWEARPATRGSLTASTALCGASCSFSPPSSIHGLQKTADLRGGEHKTRREDANLDPGDLTAAEPGQGGCGAGRSEGRSREGAGGRDGAG